MRLPTSCSNLERAAWNIWYSESTQRSLEGSRFRSRSLGRTENFSLVLAFKNISLIYKLIKLQLHSNDPLKRVSPHCEQAALGKTENSPRCILKPWQNKKCQTFVVMLGFCISFFAAGSWLKFKKRPCKNQASQQKLGSSYSFRALVSAAYIVLHSHSP